MSINLSGRKQLGLAPLSARSHPLVLGTVLFLASELMFFASMFAAYFQLRGESSVWPPRFAHLDALEGGMGTILLFSASAVMLFATRAMDRGSIAAARRWIAAAIVAAGGFLVLSLQGYARNGFSIASGAYGSIYYTLTGIHMLHVVVGMGLLSALLVGLQRGALRANGRAGAEAISYYWHFVFIVWLGIYTTVDLIR